jgi:hypothetical protein
MVWKAWPRPTRPHAGKLGPEAEATLALLGGGDTGEPDRVARPGLGGAHQPASARR